MDVKIIAEKGFEVAKKVATKENLEKAINVGAKVGGLMYAGFSFGQKLLKEVPAIANEFKNNA